MYSKSASFIESFRKPISRAAAAAVIAFSLLTIPRAFASNLGEAMEITGFGFLILAALGRVWCSIYISGRKDKMLCIDGPYQLSRNPLYFFSFLGVIGFSLALQSLSLLAISCLFYLIYYKFVIQSEELRLSAIFGVNYLRYCENTPRFFPALKPLNKVDSYSINPRIIEKSLKEVAWFLFAILAIEIVEIIHAKGYMIVKILPF